MLTELKNSVVGRASRFASIWAAIIGGGAPALTGAACLLPFFLTIQGLISINLAVQVSVILALSIMFLLGTVLGKISCRNMFFHGSKMLLVGIILTVVFLTLKLT